MHTKRHKLTNAALRLNSAKVIILGALLMFAVPSLAFAAIARDGAVQTATLSASPNSFSVTINTGDVLVVRAWSGFSPGDRYTGCTYNSVAMVQLGTSTVTSGQYSSALYFLGSPASGSHTLSCSVSTGNVGINAQPYSGASATTPLAATNHDCVSSPCTISGTSPNTNSWGIVAGMNVFPPGASGSTHVSEIDFTENAGQNWFGDSNAVTGTTGSYSQTVTGGSGINMIQFFLSPFVAPTVVPNFGSLNFFGWW